MNIVSAINTLIYSISIETLLAAFEIDIYAPDEFCFIYWYLWRTARLAGTTLKELSPFLEGEFYGQVT